MPNDSSTDMRRDGRGETSIERSSASQEEKERAKPILSAERRAELKRLFDDFLRENAIGQITDETLDELISERLEAEKKRFKIAAAAIIARKMRRAERLFELAETIEERFLTPERIGAFRDVDLISLYRETNANIQNLVKLLLSFEEKQLFISQHAQINQFIASQDSPQPSRYERDDVEINAMEALRKLAEMVKTSSSQKSHSQ